MRNEWRANIWLIVELTIIFAILWVMFYALFSYGSAFWSHRGYNTDNVYMADFGTIDKSSPLYQPYDSTHSYSTDMRLLVANLSANPYAELTGIGANSMPYNLNYYGENFTFEEADSVFSYQGNHRFVTPEIIKILQLESADGSTTDQLAEAIARGEMIVSTHRQPKNVAPAEAFVGRRVINPQDSSEIFHVAATAAGVQRSDFELLTFGGVIYTPLTDDRFPQEIAFRIKPGTDREFLQWITPDKKQLGNVYISNLQPLSRLRDKTHVDTLVTIRNFAVCALFMMIVVFLSFLGTFWFRTQQRTEEIAIRKVNGATRANIVGRLVGEGLILLGVAAAIGLVLVYLLVHYDLAVGPEAESLDISVIVSLITIGVMSLLVVAGTWMPAQKAMKIDAALALKDQ